MPDSPLTPNLRSVDCYGVYIQTSFRLGRRALAEFTDLQPRTLLQKGASFRTGYKADGYPHMIESTLEVEERFEGDVAERWGLDITCMPAPEKVGISPPRRPPFRRFIKRLGKVGLDPNADVRALFLRGGESPIVPALPLKREISGGAFTHVVGFTLARLGADPDETLYEATVRHQVGNLLRLDIGFTLRTTLGESLVKEAFDRAVSVADLIVPHEPPPVPVDNPPPTPEAAEGDESDAQSNQ